MRYLCDWSAQGDRLCDGLLHTGRADGGCRHLAAFAGDGLRLGGVRQHDVLAHKPGTELDSLNVQRTERELVLEREAAGHCAGSNPLLGTVGRPPGRMASQQLAGNTAQVTDG